VASLDASAPTIICVLCPAGANAGAFFSLLRFVAMRADSRHRHLDGVDGLLRRECDERFGRRHFDVHRQAVRVAAREDNQALVCIGDGLEMDVATEIVDVAQAPRDLDELLHRVVGRADDAGRKKQSLDVVAAIEVEREVDDLVDGEPGARNVARSAVDAVLAVVQAEIGEQQLEQRDASAVRRVAVADAHAAGRAKPRRSRRRPGRGAAGRTRRVVLGGVGENRKLANEFHLRHDFTVHTYGILSKTSTGWAWTNPCGLSSWLPLKGRCHAGPRTLSLRCDHL
jgi:hypothetical protein